MKFLSLYLPAFHEIKENNDWWGKGFTEWDNVKKATKLFKNHLQPMLPLNNEYYDLSKKEDIEKQIDLANKYKVSGFIFYHYWLNTNRLLMEKPAEILRDKIKKDIEYCFCWANHDWITTWHGKKEKILLKQRYSGKEDWIEHIKYLETFFKDERYIKVDNKPMLYIYNPSDIKDYDEMIDFWNEYLKNNGFNGIYIIEYICTKNPRLFSDKSDAVVEFEPLYTTRFDISNLNKLKRVLCKKLKIIDFQNYNYLWKKNINRKRRYKGKKIIKSCFVGWDNSPRKGKNSMIVREGTPQNFEKNLKQLLNNNRQDATNDYIVINAWNEWGEGAMLEPTEKYKYEYLEILKKIKELYEK